MNSFFSCSCFLPGWTNCIWQFGSCVVAWDGVDMRVKALRKGPCACVRFGAGVCVGQASRSGWVRGSSIRGRSTEGKLSVSIPQVQKPKLLWVGIWLWMFGSETGIRSTGYSPGTLRGEDLAVDCHVPDRHLPWSNLETWCFWVFPPELKSVIATRLADKPLRHSPSLHNPSSPVDLLLSSCCNVQRFVKSGQLPTCYF